MASLFENLEIYQTAGDFTDRVASQTESFPRGYSSLSSLTIDPSSMDLIFTSPTPDGWDFRWQDPNNTTNWISTLTTMIDNH